MSDANQHQSNLSPSLQVNLARLLNPTQVRNLATPTIAPPITVLNLIEHLFQTY